MKTIEIKGKIGISRIFIGERLKNLSALLPRKRTVIITDDPVADLYQRDFPAGDVIRIGAGEGKKTLETVAEIYRRLIAGAVDRSGFLLGIGGGVVCDVTGFAASTYLRGIGCAYAPTTLLAQVDASVGGKTGVNFLGYKNMVGVFRQPEFVVCDPLVLRTLPPERMAEGFAEIVKHAAIADAAYFQYLEETVTDALALEPAVIERVIFDSVAIKAAVVGRDETETGERRKLNFGHTFGHAVEKTTGLSHGASVSIGMMVAARLSEGRGLLKESEVERLEQLLVNFGLPVRISGDPEAIIDALARDKKREGAQIHFVLLAGIGKAVVEKIDLTELTAAMQWMRP